MQNVFITWASAMTTIMTFIFGGFTYSMQIILIMMAIDFLTALIAQWGNWDAKKAIDGVRRKVGIVLTIAIANLIGNYLHVDLRDLAIAFYIFGECISILGHIRDMGIEIPPVLMNAINKMLKDGDE